MFSDALEAEMMARLDREFWSKQRRLTTGAFRTFARAFWIQHRDQAHGQIRFAAANRFRIAFCRRHRLSLRKATIVPRRPVQSELVVRKYVEDVNSAVARLGPQRVVNMDETSWRDIQTRGKTLARIGEPTVQVKILGNVKSAMTAICTVTAAGGKLPPLYIVKGRTPAVCEKFAPHVPATRITFSDSGWMTEGLMIRYLRWLRIAMGEGPFALIVDTYPAHISPPVRWQMARSEIELIPVPRGMTGRLQPLDLGCFGPLKAESAALFDREAMADPQMVWCHVQAARLLEEVWIDLKPSTIRSGWSFCPSAIETESLQPESEEESEAVTRSDADEDYRESATDPPSEPWEPPSDGTLFDSNRRLELARQRVSRQVRRAMNEVPASFGDLPDVVDDEDAYLAEQARVIEESRRRRSIRARGRRRGRGRGRGDGERNASTRAPARQAAE
jgi:hypothetical protein